MIKRISQLIQDEDNDAYGYGSMPINNLVFRACASRYKNKAISYTTSYKDNPDYHISDYINNKNAISDLFINGSPLRYVYTDISGPGSGLSRINIRSKKARPLYKIMNVERELPCVIGGFNFMKQTKLQKRMVSDVTKRGDIIQDYMYDIAMTKVKHKFGKEIYMNSNLINYNDPNDTMLKLFNKLIKDFNTRYRAADGRILPNFMTVSKLAKYTYIYISAGTYIPDVRDSLMYDKNTTYNIYMYIWGKHTNFYYNKINEAIQRVEKKATGHSLYVINNTMPRNYDITLLSFGNRDIESLVYSYNEDKIVTRFIDKFLSDMEYYEKKQLNYKRGILLYSEPGTGKSSLVKALACKYKRSICQINIGSIDKINFNELTSMINADDEKYIVLFEDIDTLYLNRDKITEDGKNYNDIINGLLQFLDSTASPNNVIFLATTNHFDRLDEALIRDGRFDLKLEIKPLKKDDIPRFLKTLEFNGPIDDVLNAYGEPDENGLYNQSKLQNIILQLR